MSYRTVTVDGVEYKYSVGKTHVKVRGMEAVLKSEVGILEERERHCECCGEPMSAIYGDEGDYTYIVLLVRPSDVVKFIRKNVN